MLICLYYIIIHAATGYLPPRLPPVHDCINPEDFLAKEYRAAMLKRMTQGHTLSTSSEAAASLKSGAQNGSGSDSDFDNDDGGDEAFLGKYRQRRLEQLKATAGRPQFGQIAEVERASFVKAVDTEDPRTTVVVHLYEPYIEACRRMNRFLEVCSRVSRGERGVRARGGVCSVPLSCWTTWLLSTN